MKTLKGLTLLSLVSVFVGCGKSDTSFSTLPSQMTFKQNSNLVTNKLDILWVIDNSGSMGPYQTNLVTNFNSFISSFVTKGYDFKIAVTGTDAFLGDSTLSGYNSANASYAKFRDGAGSTHTGIFTILPTTPSLNSVFVTNASLGASGPGDERAFSSFRSSLNSPLNSGFLRTNSFLAVIVLSDEDDFSGNGRAYGVNDHNYGASTLEPVSTYVNYLDTLTATTGATRRYNVSNISVIDSACLAAHPMSIMGTRYKQLTEATNGVSGSICDASYATALNQIQTQIAELSTQFFLDKIPVVNTISVRVNGVSVANSATNGWTYNASANSIVFHGSAIPAQNANITIDFVPAGLG